MLREFKTMVTSLGRNARFSRFSTYMLASMINKALPFLLLPVLTHYLSPEEYGTLSLYQVIISFFIPIIGMSMQANITRHFFSESKSEVARLIFNLCLILASTFTIVMVLFSLVIFLFPSLFEISTFWLYTIPIIAAMMMLNEFNLTVLRNQGRAKLYGSFEIANTAINLFITLILVVYVGLGWEGRAFGVFLAPVIIGAVGLLRLYRAHFVVHDFNKKTINEALRISIPLVPHSLSMIIIALSDRIFLDQMLGKEAVGIYTVGYQFGMIVAISTDSFNKVWSPWMYNQLAHITERMRLRIVQFTYLYDVGVVIFAVFVTYISYFLIKLMTTEAYYGAQQFVIWVALGYALRGMYMMRFPYLVHVGKTNFLAVLTTFSAIVNLGANYILISRNGILGAAQATLLAFLIQLIGVWWYANKIYPMPWRSPALVSTLKSTLKSRKG